MQNTSIKHVVDGIIPVGTTLPRITGEITKLYARKTGVSAHGEWSFQRGEFQCISGEKIEVVFKDRDEVGNDFTRRPLTISSYETKHGLRGVTVEEDDYKGKKRLQLKVTKTADIDFVAQSDTPPPASTSASANVDDMPEQSWGDSDDAMEAAAADRAKELADGAREVLGASPAPSAKQSIDPSGFTMTRVVYRESRPLAQYQSAGVEIECTIEPGGTVANAFEALRITAGKCLDRREKEFKATGR